MNTLILILSALLLVGGLAIAGLLHYRRSRRTAARWVREVLAQREENE